MLRVILFTSLYWVLPAVPAMAYLDDYFVDAQVGDDVSGDGSVSSPWRTISYALTQVTQIDNRIQVRPGLYDSALGETFPMVVASGLELVSTEGPDQTRIVGDGSGPVVRMLGSINFSRHTLEGFWISGGYDGVHVDGVVGNHLVVLRNNTISNNARSGVYAGTRAGTENGRIYTSTVTGNLIGFLAHSQSGAGNWSFIDSAITGNTSHGVSVTTPPAPIFWPGGESFRVERTTISDNGGIGWTQKIEPFVGVRSKVTLLNSTISGNAGGGLYTRADYYCYYIPYWGYQCFDPEARITVGDSTVANNGGLGGMMRSGTSYRSSGVLANSIAWGNAPLDNINFQPGCSNIGTGFKSGGGVFTADPRFVDVASGDFRIRFDSPCVDRLALPGTTQRDFEGEQRGYDGDGNGENQDDVGADEFRTLVFPGTAPVSGQPFWFEAQAPPTEDGHLVAALLSRSKAGQGGGILVPGSGGRTADLEADSLFAFGLGSLPFLQATLVNQKALTPPGNLPGAGFAHPVFYAGVSLDHTGGQIVSITPTHSFVIQ